MGEGGAKCTGDVDLATTYLRCPSIKPTSVLRTLGDHCNRRGFPNVQGNVTPLWFAAAAQNLLHLDLSKMRLSL